MFLDLSKVLPPIIHKIAVMSNSTVIDIFHEMGGEKLSFPKLMTSDLLHPNSNGYLKIAMKIAAVVSSHPEFKKLQNLKISE